MPDEPANAPPKQPQEEKEPFASLADLYRAKGDYDVARNFDRLAEKHERPEEKEHDYDVPGQ